MTYIGSGEKFMRRATRVALWMAATLLITGTPAVGDFGARVELGAAADAADGTVACMYPMTGRGATYGRDSIHGIQVALERLSEEPDAPRLRVIVEDSRSKASFAVRMAEDFVRREGADILCGIVSSGVGRAVSQFARDNETILVGTDHASSRLTLEEGHRHYFRVSSDTWTSHAAGARYLQELQERTDWRTLAFLGPDYEYGRVAWRDLRTSLKQLGVDYEQAGTYWPRLYEPDYSLYIQALLESPPDILVTGLWGGDFNAFVQQARTTRLFETMTVANFDAGGNYDTLVSFGASAPQGLILSARHHVNWPDTERNRRFVQAFHDKAGTYPSYAAVGAYTGIIAIARATERTGAIGDTEAMINALRGLELPLPTDPPGHTSYIDPETHQIVQAQAIGSPREDHAFPPARILLGDWRVYDAESLKPSAAVLERRRGPAADASV